VVEKKKVRKTRARKSGRPKKARRGKEAQQYKCEKCGAVFTDPEMLENHKKVHLGGGGGAESGAAVVGIPPAAPRDDDQVPRPPSPQSEPVSVI